MNSPSTRLPLTSPKLHLEPFVLTALLFLALVGTWFAIAVDIPQYTDARGVLLPRGGMRPESALSKGVLESIAVKEGQTVKKGDALFKYAPDTGKAPLQAVEVASEVGGTVARVRGGPGASVRPGDWVVLILKPEAEFSAVLFVPSAQISHYRLGREVNVSLDTMPRFGSSDIRGVISKVSILPRSPEEVSQYFQLTEPAFEVVIDFSRAQLPSDVEASVLRPGSLLVGSVLIYRKPLWQWATDRMTRQP